VRAAASVDITFYSPTFGSFYGDGYGEGLISYAWLLNGIVVSSDCSSAAVGTPAAGKRYLERSEVLGASSLSDFAEIGPFVDRQFNARATTFGPENAVDYTERLPDGNGSMVSWRRVSGPKGGGRAPPALTLEYTNTTNMVTFLCTHIFVPVTSTGDTTAEEAEDVQLTIVGSTSALATIYIDSSTVIEDRLSSGRQLEEFNAAVTVIAGQWHRLVVKAMHLSWEADWEVALSVLAGEGSGVVVHSSACLPSERTGICSPSPQT
jgi:hypothetical protein